MPEPWKTLVGAGWTVRKAVELAVSIEERGEQTYRALALKWEASEDLRALFGKLAADESTHREGARKLLSSVDREPQNELDAEALQAIALGFFTDDGFALGGIEQLADRDQVLSKVLRFENATLHFYRGLKDVLGPSPHLDSLITEEKRHAVEILRVLRAADASEAPRRPRAQSSG